MPPGVLLDATAGGGGHSRILLDLGHRVIAADRDPSVVTRLRNELHESSRLLVEHSDFTEIRCYTPLNGILADLGFSSDQLADSSRGFSFDADGPLDMRMNPASHPSAAELIRSSSMDDLRRIIREFGEESSAGAIAREIAGREFSTARELAGAIARVKKPRPYRPGRPPLHPATRTFQALRIAVNDELGQLRSLLDAAPHVLAPGGRIAIITFHSLEDRIVKNAFREWEGVCRCPPRLPVCACGAKRIAFALWKGSQNADSEEVSSNPRSRSARIRAMEMAGDNGDAADPRAGHAGGGGKEA